MQTQTPGKYTSPLLTQSAGAELGGSLLGRAVAIIRTTPTLFSMGSHLRMETPYLLLW